MVCISTKSTYFNVFIYTTFTTLHTKFKRNIALAVPEIQVPETCRIFFVFFFFFASNNKSVHKLCSCATKFGARVALPKPYISTKFGTIRSKIAIVDKI